MTSFAERCGIHDAERESALAQTCKVIDASGLELVRFGWCDMHGVVRGKTLVASAVEGALRAGVGLVSSAVLKDTSDRTAFKIFEKGGTADLPGFEFAGNTLLMADPSTLKTLPWAERTGWLRGQLYHPNGKPVTLDTRHVLRQALKRLADAGYGMNCGLEVEFHIYRIEDESPAVDPELAGWPGLPPRVSMLHPGYHMLAETNFDLTEEPLRIVQRTAQALGLPLSSLEIEFGPSQVEAVFDVTDALTAADNMVLFRNATRQALRRAGYYATFVCRPPFPHIMSSGWHLHQSLVDLKTGANVFRRSEPAPGATPADAQFLMSAVGEHYMAGLLDHARGMAVFCTPTVNGFGRFRPNALAPMAALWGRDNRGAMLRLVGECGDAATRVENRIGEPTANPYLYIASQIHAGLDGIERKLKAPPATDSPYAAASTPLPTNLGDALDALKADTVLCQAFGDDLIKAFERVKRAEVDRYEQAADKDDFQRREYFSRF